MHTNSNQSPEATATCKQEVMDRLKIKINLLFTRLNEVTPEGDEYKRSLNELDQRIVCSSLLGYTPTEIAIIEGKSNSDSIADTLSRLIYGRISRMLKVDKKQIAGNWAKIIYHLLGLENGFRLEPIPMPNLNTLMSFGNHILFHSHNPDVSMFQQNGAQSYSIGAYYSAFESFGEACNRNKGEPELLIYMNNCLIEEYKITIQSRKIEFYTIAVVVPINHNMGKVAKQLLYGVAQMQLKLNLQTLDNLNISDITNACNRLRTCLGINKIDYSLPVSNGRMVLRVLILNENNELFSQDGVTFNQAARDLAQVASELEIMAVIGHYSSEMTKQALGLYDRRELLLMCPSSTSDELSNVVGMNSFFRITTQDRIATQRVVNYLLYSSQVQETLQKVTIIYNKNSSYCQSFKNGVREFLEKYPEKYYLLPECGELYDDYLRCLEHLGSIQDQGVNTIIIIPDGGIEANTLNTTGIITRLLMNQCLIVGSATFYHDNVLHWAEENIRQGLLDKNNASNLVACVPWHFQSLTNGCNSSNAIAADFCRLGAKLWGEGKLSWRSATAYDAVLMIVKALQRYAPQDYKVLRKKINQYFRHEHKFESGVTGRIEFEPNGDRLNPPTEIAVVKWDEDSQRCFFVPSELLNV